MKDQVPDMDQFAGSEPDKQQKSKVQRGSFILRCWTISSGEILGYLLDARSGARHPVNDLSNLPALIRSLLMAGSMPSPDEELEGE